ncbi:hypothetical protein [Streptomyces decoyicus]
MRDAAIGTKGRRGTAGEYGAGTVIVWDRGTFRPLPRKKKGRTLSFGQALADGP